MRVPHVHHQLHTRPRAQASLPLTPTHPHSTPPSPRHSPPLTALRTSAGPGSMKTVHQRNQKVQIANKNALLGKPPGVCLCARVCACTHTQTHSHTHYFMHVYNRHMHVCSCCCIHLRVCLCVLYERERQGTSFTCTYMHARTHTHTHTTHTPNTPHTHTQHTHTPMYDRCWERGGGQQERDRPQAHVSAEQALRASAQRPRRNGVWTCVYECMCAVVRFRFVYAHAGVRVFACKGIHTLGARPAHCTGHDGKCDQTGFRV